MWITFRRFFDGDFALGGAASDFCMLLRREDVYAMIVALHSFHFIVMAGWDSSLIVASTIDKNIKPLIFLSVSMEDYEFNNS